VLFDRPGRHPGQVAGRSPYLQPVQVMAPTSLIGEVVPVRIIGVGSNSLFGALADGLANPPRQADHAPIEAPSIETLGA